MYLTLSFPLFLLESTYLGFILYAPGPGNVERVNVCKSWLRTLYFGEFLTCDNTVKFGLYTPGPSSSHGRSILIVSTFKSKNTHLLNVINLVIELYFSNIKFSKWIRKDTKQKPMSLKATISLMMNFTLL